mgnify:CR=1 FL=1
MQEASERLGQLTRPEDPAQAGTHTGGTAPDAGERQEDFEELIRGRYKADFDARVKKILDGRLRGLRQEVTDLRQREKLRQLQIQYYLDRLPEQEKQVRMVHPEFRLQKEKDDLERIVDQQKHQYEITRDMIERINEHCHDIKHQIHSVSSSMDNELLKEYLGTLADHVMVYDMAIRTENKALDTVLMEKGLLCREKQIQWICMADGSKMSFIKPCDIYAVFGNLIDNAIEATENLEDMEKRVINVRVTTHESLMMIEVENLYEGDLHFEGNLPVTTKENRERHGYGMRSVEYIVGTYGGTFTMQAEDSVFRTRILIPIP